MIPTLQLAQFGRYGPSGPSDSLRSLVEFHTHFDGTDNATTADDTAPTNIGFTFAADAKLKTASARYGTAALDLDGTGDYVETAVYSPTLDIALAEHFALECSVWFDDTGTTRGIIALVQAGSPDNMWYVYRTSGNKLALFVGSSSVGFVRITGTTNITGSAWHDVLLQRDGSAMRLALDGAQEGTWTSSSGGFQNWDGALSTKLIRFGSYYGTSEFLDGRIDEARLTVGHKRYDLPYTPAVAAFPDQ